MITDYIKKNDEALSWLKGNLDEERLLHSLGSAQCAVELAEKFGLDEKRAYIAGLLHDCAKCLDEEHMLKIAHEINLDKEEFVNYKVLHAPVSAYVAKTEFGIEDEEILSAIRWHTLGRPDMTLFEKIIFLADKIEPHTRDMQYRANVMMLLDGPDGLNKALLLCYKETIKSLIRRDLKICQATIDIYNSLQK